MKRIYIIIISIVLLFAFSLYKYVYKNHRDISTEEASFTINSKTILDEYNNSEQKANEKYLDKTIIVKGIITNLDTLNKTLVIDEKMFCLIDSFNSELKINKLVSVKGRFLGYDELLEEMKMDQISIIK